MHPLIEEKEDKTIFYPDRVLIVGFYISLLIVFTLTYFTYSLILDEGISTANGRWAVCLIVATLIFSIYFYIKSKTRIIINWQRKEITKHDFKGYTCLANLSEVAEINETSQHNLRSYAILFRHDTLGLGIDLARNISLTHRISKQMKDFQERLDTVISEYNKSASCSDILQFVEIGDNSFIYKRTKWANLFWGFIFFVFSATSLYVVYMASSANPLYYLFLPLSFMFIYLSFICWGEVKEEIQINRTEDKLMKTSWFGLYSKKYSLNDIELISIHKCYTETSEMQIIKTQVGVNLFLLFRHSNKKKRLITYSKSELRFASQIKNDLHLILQKPIEIFDIYKKEPHSKV